MVNEIDKLLTVFLFFVTITAGHYTYRNHSVTVSTIFIGNVQQEVVATWIIALAIIGGILIFGFVVIGLTKVSKGCSKVQFSF